MAMTGSRSQKSNDFLGSDDNVQEICDQCKPEILNISAKLDEQQGLNKRLEIQVNVEWTRMNLCPFCVCPFCPI